MQQLVGLGAQRPLEEFVVEALDLGILVREPQLPVAVDAAYTPAARWVRTLRFTP